MVKFRFTVVNPRFCSCGLYSPRLSPAEPATAKRGFPTGKGTKYTRYGKVCNGLFPVFPHWQAGISLGNSCRNKGGVSAYKVSFNFFLSDF